MMEVPVAEGEVFAGKYRVEQVLGEGGMGVVVRAHHLELDQPVAVKFLLGDVAAEPEGAERFRREARAAAKIQSDHVVRVLDVGVLDSGERYMVMEYLDGHDLAEELEQRGALPIAEACGYVLEALDAVGHAHAVGIVHRDLKPANLFLARRPDGRSRVKVVDFGISKTIGSATAEQLSLTKTSAWIGSPLYMAPEQMQSARDVDARADVWSLGAIFYEMLVGEPPYVTDSLPQLCNLLLTTDATDIRERRPDVPADLARVIMRCLVRDPAGRLQSVDELAAVVAMHAATATGSPMSSAFLARTEMASSAQGQSVTGAGASATRGSDGATRAFGRTEAAWGGTGAPEKRGANKKPLVFLAAGVLVAILAGFVAAVGVGGSSDPEEDAEVEPLAPDAPEPTAASTSPAVEEPPRTRTPEAASSADADAPDPSEDADEIAGDDSKPVQPATSAPSPKPQPKTRPAPAPKPSPQPSKDPQPSSESDFEDFGGRR